MTLAQWCFSLMALMVLAPVVVLLVEVIAAMPRHAPRNMPQGRRPSIGILMPAHNESLMIADTLRLITPHLCSTDRMLVVADNCTDNTAHLAAAAGAEVVERTNPTQRGKIHALDFGIRHYAGTPPEVVIIVDADCRVDAGAIERLARACVEAQRPVQGLYLMRAAADAGLRMRIAEFAWLVKNQVRALGSWRMGLACQLMGSGMALPWSCISTVPLEGGHIAEDYKLGLDLARAGAAAQFYPDARITSDFPSNAEGIAGQRMRWEHGHIALILSIVPQLLLEAVEKRNKSLFSLALDLAVPPLALLSLLVVAVGVLNTAFYLFSGAVLPMQLAAAALCLLVVSILLSWFRYARHILSLRDLLHAPAYALRKVSLYWKFVVNRQVEWVRSRRDGE